MVNANQLYNTQGVPRHSTMSPSGSQGLVAVSSFDDMHLYNRPSQEDAKRTRRRSMHTIDTPDFHKGGLLPGDATRSEGPSTGRNADKGSRPSRVAPHTAHSRSGSSESVTSTRSSHSRASSVSFAAGNTLPNEADPMHEMVLTGVDFQATNRNVSAPTGNPSLPASEEAPSKTDQPKLVNIPPRGSSSDAAAKRTLNPSPLSKPATMVNDPAEDSRPPAAESSGSAGANLESPAAKQLAAINQKGGKAKSKTSRLRRAFSFGSAADFRKAAGGEGDDVDKSEPSRLHKDPTPDEAYDAEQARIAEAQEAAGIGNSIYSGRFFGSTDNLSISSTASSASIMIRKMGRGMKKSTRSLVGLFRPKSVIGVPAAEALAPEASQAEVSMITVEAETQRVNVTADPSAGNGGTGFPHLERNSLDASQVPEMMTERLGSSGTDKSAPRKSIVGGDKERAEVLAAVRKGILKRKLFKLLSRSFQFTVLTDGRVRFLEPIYSTG